MAVAAATVAGLFAGTAAYAAPPQPIEDPASATSIVRLGGATRYETSVAVSQRYEPGVAAAFVATGTDYPDALAAAAAAASLGAPLLLTQPGALPLVVAEELARLQPTKIYVLGGTGAVSASVVARLSAMAPTERIGGADRYSTAEKLIDTVFGSATHIFLATGLGFPDALGASGAAGSLGAPLLLVNGRGTTLPASTMEALKRWGVADVSIAGGHGAIDLRIEQQLRTEGFTVSRHAGASRYETAAALYNAYFTDAAPDAAFLATGTDYPDALSAAALAGRMQAPLLLTQPECVPWAPHVALSTVSAPERIVIGGEGAVSEAAAANTPCSSQPPAQPGFAMTGWQFDPAAAAPYSDRPPVNVDDPAIVLDATGLRVYLRRDNGARADHPVAYAQYGISALMEYQRTGDTIWLDRATRHAERLEQIHTERAGAWWFPYMFPWTYYQRTLTEPWWSGMAQGQALSLFVRLYDETGDARWENAAHRTWQSFLQPRSQAEPWSTLVDGDRLFFEEYAGDQPPLLVLNGHVFAIFGIYDYWRLTDDPDALRLLDGGATTTLAIMPDVRNPGAVSYYCVQPDYCKSPLWQNSAYHAIHSWQLDTLARLTHDESFSEWADLLRDDWTPAAGRFSAPDEPSLPLGWDDGPPQ
ncbi:cell wall-binding repeat-containing protein [Microbacterium sp. cf046]|uniref:cell wall-binding repeat-containing protein n=1 Tax=Microbacterium sp. cf046 TaxID=1761803 RepID=UPI0015870DE4|nr:cell wall-binding repeat-containing protein [Microbacterium sp. cf046]